MLSLVIYLYPLMASKKQRPHLPFFSIKNALSGLEGENTYMMVIMQIMSDDMYLKIIGNWSSASHV